MYENKCAICGQPILGYWFRVEKKDMCQSCAAVTTVYDLFQRDIIDIKPDIVETEATLVTKDDEKVKAYVAAKNQLNSEYGMAVKDIDDAEATLVTKDEDDDFPIPDGCSKDCPHYPYDTCGHYYGEIHACMLGEEEIESDIENMSQEDFMSKYADNPGAIGEYMSRHPEECNA